MKRVMCSRCSPPTLGIGTALAVRILEAGVPYVCPSCGLIYSFAKRVNASTRFSDEARSLAGFVCFALLLCAGAIYADKLLVES